MEGIHLYRLIVTVYGSEKQMAMVYYSIGWGEQFVSISISYLCYVMLCLRVATVLQNQMCMIIALLFFVML